MHNTPCVGGWSGSPVTLIALPFSTVTRIAHVSGQSCGQTARATWVAAFIVLNTEMGVRKFYVDAPNKAFISQRFWTICPAVEWKGSRLPQAESSSYDRACRYAAGKKLRLDRRYDQ
ncbi:hypothetical protein BO443_180169 [Burkholderia orbicola]